MYWFLKCLFTNYTKIKPLYTTLAINILINVFCDKLSVNFLAKIYFYVGKVMNFSVSKLENFKLYNFFLVKNKNYTHSNI